eukprot:scaffold1574_cov119-Isochrysis_galbana.AAC.13
MTRPRRRTWRQAPSDGEVALVRSSARPPKMDSSCRKSQSPPSALRSASGSRHREEASTHMAWLGATLSSKSPSTSMSCAAAAASLSHVRAREVDRTDRAVGRATGDAAADEAGTAGCPSGRAAGARARSEDGSGAEASKAAADSASRPVPGCPPKLSVPCRRFPPVLARRSATPSTAGSSLLPPPRPLSPLRPPAPTAVRPAPPCKYPLAPSIAAAPRSSPTGRCHVRHPSASAGAAHASAAPPAEATAATLCLPASVVVPHASEAVLAGLSCVWVAPAVIESTFAQAHVLRFRARMLASALFGTQSAPESRG